MFNPIKASENIKQTCKDYLVSSFGIADKEYNELFKNELEKEGVISKGPYLEIGDSYETSKTLDTLISEGLAHKSFRFLEDCDEKDREIPLHRPLYTHQQEALQIAGKDENIILTTGTGSGKTECFLFPILNALLTEKERGTLDCTVRALIIYPMNALANDQLKRMRNIFKSGNSEITFGLYSGDTEEHQSQAERKYADLNKDKYGKSLKPLKNEVISREKMRESPPHILITNYAMLEYMLLRPNDGAVFQSSKLKFIVLDEAHIYRGAKGIEMSMLIKRLMARISAENVRYILTSATLGGENKDIVEFAKTLCNSDFKEKNIIRSVAVKHDNDIYNNLLDVPIELFSEIANPSKESFSEILQKYRINCFTETDKTIKEKIFTLALKSKVYHKLRDTAREPFTIKELANKMNLTEQNIIDLISVFAQGSKNKVSLMKARYHTFMRSLQGAYITLGDNKKMFLIPQKESMGVIENDRSDDLTKIFEAAVCADCGRLAVCGEIEHNKLEQSCTSLQFRENNQKYDYFLLKDSKEENFYEEEDDKNNKPEKNDFMLCSKCGSILEEYKVKNFPCDCGEKFCIDVKKCNIKESCDSDSAVKSEPKCPACEKGSLRKFYAGNDALTSAIATSLFEELPKKETTFIESSDIESFENSEPDDIFATDLPVTESKDKRRQFLCFSDSRSEAAYFACYLEKSYEEFLRRRAIYKVLKEGGEIKWDIRDFVKRLIALFDENKTFAEPEEQNSTETSLRNAWIAVLNEMYNARRDTSFTSLGLLKFKYKGDTSRFADNLARKYNIEIRDCQTLLDSLVFDIVLMGALKGKIELTDTEREYIFYSPYQKYVKLCKKSGDVTNISGFASGAKTGTNGGYYKNSRLVRVMDVLKVSEKEANDFLSNYWSKYLASPENQCSLTEGRSGEYLFEADRFEIVINSELYKCKKCGKRTVYNIKNKCINYKCDGILEQTYPNLDSHYLKLYSSPSMSPLHIKEHTGQLERKNQTKYQQWFQEKKISALSCSTTFEMGVDLGSLETVFLRNIPPSPANYIQRSGRAGRSWDSAAFCLTYCKLSSHDFTFYKNPLDMIKGQITAPIFTAENEKIIRRHIYAVAFALFFKENEDVYNRNNADIFLNKNGFERFCSFLNSSPLGLKQMLTKLITEKSLHENLEIESFGWTNELIGEDGILNACVKDYRDIVDFYEKEIKSSKNDLQTKADYERKLKNFRRSPDDNKGKNNLIEFLVRGNILPKYGFPVDTAELHTNSNLNLDGLNLQRDLQLAVSEYAPGSQVVADGKIYTSRYIKKNQFKTQGSDWEISYIAECKCGQMNYSKIENDKNYNCVACNNPVDSSWLKTIEPRKGFIAEKDPKNVSMSRRPEKIYRSEDFYLGDKERKELGSFEFEINNHKIKLLSTSNDSLMTVCKNCFFVCLQCGYTEHGYIKGPSKKIEHYNSLGYKCTKDKLEKRLLSHVFKTDVVKLTFDLYAESLISVLYALLEAMSKELDIERNDIKGIVRGKDIILYDAVAGGAGQVRRLVDKNGENLHKVIKKAVELTENCDCNPSCYACLRNYYNQSNHDKLDRIKASKFLRMF